MRALLGQLALPTTDPLLAPPAHAKPILRYVGGKRWILPLVSAGVYRYLARTGGRYLEPFLGGGALALDLGLRHRADAMIVSDLCASLMSTYETVSLHPGQVAQAVQAYALAGIDEETYYQVRDERPVAPDFAAARFLYLNATCFNGVYRENASGVFNVPYGRRKAPHFPSADDLCAFAVATSHTIFAAADFVDALENAEEGDLVFADPPYDDTFGNYTAGGFGVEHQERLAHALEALSEMGVCILATNADTPLVRKLYGWAEVVPTAEARAVNADAKGRGRVGCVLITNQPAILGTP